MARIAGNTTLYLFFFSIIVLFLYVMGNLQGFLEGTLLLLLKTLEWSLFIFIITDIYYFVFSIVRISRRAGGYAAPFKAAGGLTYGLGLLLGLNFMLSWFFW